MRICVVCVFAIAALNAHAAQFPFFTYPVTISASTVDSQGNVYLTGSTLGPIPVTPNAFQRTFNATICGYVSFGGVSQPIPCDHGFVAKVSADGSTLIYATYLGGSGQDFIDAIAADSEGNVYVAGHTNSPDFPVTPGAYRTKLDTYGDGFLTKLSADGSSVLASTLLPGDADAAVAIGKDGSVYVAGSASANFPATPGAFQTAHFPNNSDAGVMKFDGSLKSLIWATLIGGSDQDSATAIAVDAQNDVYIAGLTGSNLNIPNYTRFPVTPGAYSHFSTGADVFVSKINPGGTALIYSSVFGGAGDDGANALAIGPDGSAYVAGYADSNGFPVTAGAYRKNDGGGFIAKLSPDGSRLVYSTRFGGSVAALALAPSGDLFFRGAVNYVGYGFFPTVGALHPCLNATMFVDTGNHEYFAELNATGTAQIYATYFDNVAAIDPTGDVWSSSQTQLLDRNNVTAPLPPQITCVANAADYRAGAIAPGEIVSLFGPGIGPAQPSQLQIDSSGKVHAHLGGLSVYFNRIAAPLLYVSANQINAVAPFELAGRQNTSVVILKDGSELPQITLPVADAAAAIFTRDGSGAGAAAALNEDGSVNSALNPAATGSLVSIFATGVGAMEPAPADGALGNGKTKPAAPIAVNSLGGDTLDIQYAGDAPGLVEGLVQINVRLPQIPTGNTVLLAVEVGSTPFPAISTFVYVK